MRRFAVLGALVACSPAPEPKPVVADLAVPRLLDAGAPATPTRDPPKSAHELEREECKELTRHMIHLAIATTEISPEQKAQVTDEAIKSLDPDSCAKMDEGTRGCLWAAKTSEGNERVLEQDDAVMRATTLLLIAAGCARSAPPAPVAEVPVASVSVSAAATAPPPVETPRLPSSLKKRRLLSRSECDVMIGHVVQHDTMVDPVASTTQLGEMCKRIAFTDGEIDCLVHRVEHAEEIPMCRERD